jgi:hypothetical protein
MIRATATAMARQGSDPHGRTKLTRACPATRLPCLKTTGIDWATGRLKTAQAHRPTGACHPRTARSVKTPGRAM